MGETMFSERRTGRPDQKGAEDLERRLIETAAKLFTEQGYAATSVDQVAAAAGMGKQTIYRRHATKEDLFKAVVGEHMIGRVVEAWARRMDLLAMREQERSASPLEILKQICRSTLDFMLDPNMVRLHRLLIAEERLSVLSFNDIQSGALVFEGIVSRQLKAAEEAGEIPIQKSPYVQQALLSMLSGWASKQSLLLGVVVEADARDAFFDCAWSLFLHGVKGGADHSAEALSPR